MAHKNQPKYKNIPKKLRLRDARLIQRVTAGWVKKQLASGVVHNDTTSKEGGDGTYYYHLSKPEYDFFDINAGATAALFAVDASDVLTYGGNVVFSGDVTVEGTTTIIDTETLQVKDKNIEMAVVDTPTDITADGGGITLKGATDKTLIWDNANDNWTSSEHWNLTTGKEFKINNVAILDADTLGSSVVNSSLTNLGTLTELAITNSGAAIVVNLTNTLNTGIAGYQILNDLSHRASIGLGGSTNALNPDRFGIYTQGYGEMEFVINGNQPFMWKTEVGDTHVVGAYSMKMQLTAAGVLEVDTIDELTADAGITIEGILLKDSIVTTDTISEKTADTGVTIDGLTIKDSTINQANGVKIDSLDIDGGTDIGAALATTDLIVVDDGAGGTNRKSALSRLVTLMETELLSSADPEPIGETASSGSSSDAAPIDHVHKAESLESTITVGITATTGTITLESDRNELGIERIGNLVHIHGELIVDSVSSPTGISTLTGNTLTCANLTDRAGRAVGVCVASPLASILNYLYCYIVEGSTDIVIKGFDGDSLINAAPVFQASTVILIDLWFRTSD